MKTYYTLLLIGLWWSLGGLSIGLAQKEPKEIQANLTRVAGQLQQGVYERVINLGYVSSPDRIKKEELMAHNELTMVVMRFWGFEPVNDHTAYVGRVFMGERYIELDYNKKYCSQKAYETDNDGFFYACKLYFDERTLEYRLNIYPDHVLNICRASNRFIGIGLGSPFTGMHFNKKVCTYAQQHWESLKYVIAPPDQHYDAYTAISDTASTRRFFSKAQNSPVNIMWNYLSRNNPKTREDSIDVRPSIRQTYPLREINIRKHIKCFKVGSLNDSIHKVGQTLSLKFTKYALSEDLLEGNEYSYHKIQTQQLDSATLTRRKQIGRFVSRNPLYRSLIVSLTPDDKFVPGFDIDERLCIYYWDNTFTQPTSAAQSQISAELKRENSEIATTQKNYIPRSGRCPLDSLFISISSDFDDNVHWIFAERQKAGIASKLAPQTDYIPSTYQYLRESKPRQDQINKLWIKGPIRFIRGKNQHFARPDQKWTIMAVEPYDGQDGYIYYWIAVKPKPS